jgi:hypothetical protein
MANKERKNKREKGKKGENEKRDIIYRTSLFYKIDPLFQILLIP